MRDRGARGEIEQLPAIAEQHVILSHAARPPSLGGEGATMRRSPDGPEQLSGPPVLKKDPSRQKKELSGDPGGSSP
jgi:hypothetical protein